MILIYVSIISPRISYITRYIFNDVLKVQYKITLNKEEFTQYQGPKINYSFEEFESTITLLPNKFILQSKIIPIEVEVSWVGEIPVLFHECADVDLPFDPFSASFYLVSRYEEYIPGIKDIHNRFTAKSSVAYKNNFLDIPAVNYWAIMIKDAILKKYPSCNFPKLEYQYIPTIDVDVAYAYLGRNLIRTAGAVLKKLYDLKSIKLRMNTLLGKNRDPYDTFDLINEMHTAYNLNPVWFFQVGKYGRFDKNLNPDHILMQNLIRQISNKSSAGLHPSYNSDSEFETVYSEKQVLESVIGKTVTKSRQHYLKITLPQTYKVLEECGIREDFSMGYADQLGFRAGTCTPFKFYDLLFEKETDLCVVPFCIMDGTLNNYLGLDTNSALQKVQQIISQVKNVNGTLVTLWHNQSFSETNEWKGWKDFYSRMLEIAV